MKTRLNILLQMTACEGCGEYAAHCQCRNDAFICPACGQALIDCNCDDEYTPYRLNVQMIRPAVI